MKKKTGRIDYESMEAQVKLDTKDKKILTLLAENSRIPLTRIAKKVQLSRDSVDYRIKRLEKAGIILKFFANVRYDKLGYYLFHVFFLLDEMNKGEQIKLLSHLKNHQNIYSIIEYSDRWDIEIVIAAKDLLEFDIIIMDISAKFPHVIMEKDKVEIIKRYTHKFLPSLLKDKDLYNDKIVYDRAHPVKLNQIDFRILRLLSEDCRMSTYKIGEKLNVSADTVSYRINNLLKEEVIKNFTILVNLSKLNYFWYTFSVEMKMFDKTYERKLGEYLKHNSEILRAAKTLGGWDLLLYIVVEHPRDFHKIVKGLKNVFAPVIKNYQTWVAYKEHIFKTMPEIIGKQD